MASPYFSCEHQRNEGRAQSFYDMEEGQSHVDNASVRALWLNHPQGCMGFRLETEDRSPGLRDRQRAGR